MTPNQPWLQSKADRSIQQQVDYLAQLVSKYPIASIEDGMAEDDFEGRTLLTKTIGAKCQLVGDDLLVTNVKSLADGIRQGVANSILVKVNQIGTLTETLAAVEMVHRAAYTTVMSHRSGETEHATIADLAVATIADRSRPARSRARTGRRNTISFFASNRSWVRRRCIRGGVR